MASENKRKIGADVNELLKRKENLNSRTKYVPKTTIVKDINPSKVFTEKPIVSMPISTKKADTKKKVSAFSVPEFPKVELPKNNKAQEVVAVPINANDNEENLFEFKSAIYFEFIDFLATPPFVGKGIRTQKQFAKAYKIEESTLSRWKKKKGFYEEVKARVKILRKDRTTKILDRFYEQMIRSRKPVGRDFLVWLQYVEDFNPKLGLINETPIDRRLDPEQRRQLAQAWLNGGMATLEQAQTIVNEGLQPEDLEA